MNASAVTQEPRFHAEGNRNGTGSGQQWPRRALGAARTGNAEAARKELQELASLRDSLVQTKETYWAEQVEIQQEITAAWLMLAEGKKEALQKMRAAASHEDATDKHPVTPGVVLPARELLGDMLLELKQPAQALAEFEATLGRAPNRFNALAGAAHSAVLSGEHKKARDYFAKLLALSQNTDEDRPELHDAKVFLAQK